MTQRVHALCRACGGMCPIIVEVENGRPVRIQGNKENPLYEGYTCLKGRETVRQMYNRYRCYQSQRRRADGGFEPIAAEQALDEVSSKLQAIIAEHGPRAVATYGGTYTFAFPATQPFATAWMDAIGSPMRFSAGTIDQPGKGIAFALHGNWYAGAQSFDESDTWLLVGINPIVSRSAGIPNQNPVKRLREAVARGLKLIVVDPCRTECARHAAIHLQGRPGEDPTIIAGLIRQIIVDELCDRTFIAEEVENFEVLKAAVQPFTPEYVARRAGVAAQDLIAAARTFARARKGAATAGTGPNMSPRGNLTEYLLLCLLSICGRWRKSGDKISNPGVLAPKFIARAEATPPYPAWGFGEQLRVRGFTSTVVGLPMSALPDEILMPGKEQIRALIILGGNPLMTWPDQRKAIRALRALDLLVCLDIHISPFNAAQFAHYVMMCKHSLESPAMTLPNELLTFFGPGWGFCVPYAQYSPAVVDPPPGADLIDDWEFFYGLAQRMGLQLELTVRYPWVLSDTLKQPSTIKIDMRNKPTTDEIFQFICAESRVPLDTVKRFPGGHIFAGETVYVAPKREGMAGARLQVGDPTMMQELANVAGEAPDYQRDPEFPFRLICRRVPNIFNSSGRENPAQLRKWKYNPAFMHPTDLDRLGLTAGNVVRIESKYDFVAGVVESDPTVREGVIAMAHGFGGLPEEDDRVREIGTNVNRLIRFEHEYDPYTGIPRMSAIPVRVYTAR